MANPSIEQLIAAQGFPNGGMMRVPSDEEKREVLKVQGMQVRTQAASMASAMLQHRQTSVSVWSKWAKHIEAYIRGEVPVGDAATPVLPRSQAG